MKFKGGVDCPAIIAPLFLGLNMNNKKDNHSYVERIARIDERTLQIEKTLQKLSEDLKDDYVKKDEFAPIKAIVYGMVSMILAGVFAAILALILGNAK